MDKNVYKVVIENSDTAYCEVEGIKNSNGDYIDLKLTYTNNALKNSIFKDYLNIDNKKIKKFIIEQLGVEFINRTLKVVKDKGKYHIDEKFKICNKYWNIDIFNGGKDTFVIKIYNSEVDDGDEKLQMDFFANISHEFRTPINIILSSLQVFKLKVNELNSEDKMNLSKYINLIEQNSFRLLKLSNNIIDTTKLESGYLEYNPKNGNIIKFVEDICMSVIDFIHENSMDIVFDTDIEEEIVAFDQDKMERIMLNLISNAIKFNSKDGTISIGIKCGEEICISVKDQGIGMPKEKLNTIFDRYKQIKRNSKNTGEGSGIGLSLVKSLAEIHGGNVSVTSKLGEGSEFIVHIPRILISSGEIDDNKSFFSENQIHRMNIEFSDIYT